MSKPLSIKEFSKLTGVESSRLRHWEDVGVFIPKLRNPNNKYRYYDISQLPALNFVVTMCKLKIPLKTILEIQDSRTAESILDIFDSHELQLNKELKALQIRHSIICARRELIRLGSWANIDEIKVEYLKEKNMTLWPQNEYHADHTFFDALVSHTSTSNNNRSKLSYPLAGLHADTNSFKDSPEFPDNFLTVDLQGDYVLDEGEYLIGYATGSYGKLGSLPDKMFEHAQIHSLLLSGPVYTFFLHDEICLSDPESQLVQVCMSISKPHHSKIHSER